VGRRFSTKQMGKGKGGALADDGTRTVKFSAVLFYNQFVEFLWVRVPDNRRETLDWLMSVRFLDNPNAQVRGRARELGGTWS
jgi:hypothetical protein